MPGETNDTIMLVGGGPLQGYRFTGGTLDRVAVIPANADQYVVSPAAPVAYSVSFEGRLEVVDLSDHAVLATADLPPGVSGIEISPDEQTIYLTTREGLRAGAVSALWVIETTAFAVVDQIPMPGLLPRDVKALPDGSHVYVKAPPLVKVVETATNTVVASIFVANSSAGGEMVVSPDGASVYVPLLEAGLFEIDVATNTVGNIRPGGGVGGLAVAPDGRSVVFSGGVPGVPGSHVIRRDLTSGVETRAPLEPRPGAGPRSLGLTPDGAFAFVPADAPSVKGVYVFGTEPVAQLALGGGTAPFRGAKPVLLATNVVTVNVVGTGSVVSVAEGFLEYGEIHCPDHRCAEDFLPTEEFQLRAVPTPGSWFDSWAGDCTEVASNWCTVRPTTELTATATFLAAPDFVIRLIEIVGDLGLADGIESALTATLEAALNSVENDRPASIHQIQAFTNQVEAMRGEGITSADADVLIAQAQIAIGLIEAS